MYSMDMAEEPLPLYSESSMETLKLSLGQV